MQPLRKGMLIVGAPLALAAMLGGAAAFASQSGGADTAPMAARSHSTTHQKVSQAPGEVGKDGTGCPNDKGASSTGDGAVSPAVY